MKTKVLYIACLALIGFGLSSCEKESANKTMVTIYADMQLEGDDYMVIDKGSTYTDPGFSATVDGKDVSANVKIIGEVDSSVSGVYTILYTYTNSDGFTSSLTRIVVVLDPNDAVEGFYTITPDSYRIYDGGAPVEYGDAYEVLVIGEGDGVYTVDDLMAGWYALRAGYGSSYAMQGVITIADDGTIALEDSYVPGWGDGANALENGKFDATAGTITYKLTYAEVIEFNVTLVKE